jgi:ABC-type antimicrobial peptide transport system permease subunit
MFLNYLKIAFRNLWRNKTFSFINIFGLALGMTFSLLIYLWIQDELRMDAFHTNNPRLFRMMETQYYDDGKVFNFPSCPGLLADALKKEVPEVAQAAMYTWDINELFRVGDKANKEKGIYAGEDFVAMFSHQVLKGDAKAMLDSPNKIVITEKLAKNYFGTDNPIGKTMRMNNEQDFQVSGVLADISRHSSIKFDFLLSFKYFLSKNDWVKNWENNGPRCVVMLHPKADYKKVNAKIKNFLTAKKDKGDNKIEIFLQPYAEMYLYGKFTNGKQDGGRIEYVQVFSLIAVFILLIASINFMNLATARSVKRAKEVGIRKVIGAYRNALVVQFMGEAILTVLLAMIAALLLVEFTLPFFNTLTEKQLYIPFLDIIFWLKVSIFVVIIGLISGSYPALFLSSLQPVKILKGTLKFKPSATLFRKGLVVFQFTLAVVLIISTLVIYQQTQFIQTKNLGVDRENMISQWIEGDLAKNFKPFKNELLQSPGIQSITTATQLPIDVGNSTVGVEWPGKDPKAKILFSNVGVTFDFIKTNNIKLLEGRDFSPEYGTDTSNIIINEMAAKVMNLKDPVGQTITFWEKKGKIIGLMKDFHLQSLHTKIEPLILFHRAEPEWGTVLIKTQAGKTKEALASLEKLHKKFNPKFPFTYQFIDETFKRQYRSETVVGQLAFYFAFLGIFISCLGLFGLAMFTAEQRTKEIGIRKVLGASLANIITLISKDFVRLVLIANVIAIPVAWWAMQSFLQGYAYHIDLSWGVFVLAGVLAVFIALFTVSFQAFKASTVNPVEVLKNE